MGNFRSEDCPVMRNFRLTIEYDGSDFHGWQVQPDMRTVQGEILRALSELSHGPVKLVGAGRTDAGVHAAGQVASAGLETDLALDVVKRALNAKLPRDIWVRHAEEAHARFNARFDARSRTYRYVFIRRRTALWRKYFYYVDGDLDLRAMRVELSKLIGEKDFTSFTSAADVCMSKRCRVIGAEITDSGPLLSLTVQADHFLYHMMRVIAGTILEAGRGVTLDMNGILEARERSMAGPMLPPYALYLMEVTY